MNYKIYSANRGDSLDRIIDEENRQTKDFLILVSYQKKKFIELSKDLLGNVGKDIFENWVHVFCDTYGSPRPSGILLLCCLTIYTRLYICHAWNLLLNKVIIATGNPVLIILQLMLKLIRLLTLHGINFVGTWQYDG